MVKILIVVFLGVFLLTPSRSVARDYKTNFNVGVQIGESVATSDGTNKEPVQVPITDTLKAKGWTCSLTPKRVFNNGLEIGQAIQCVNKTGDSISTFVHCATGQVSAGQSMMYLDHTDTTVQGTTFLLTCKTIAGEKI
jgi:hypothetical protein